MTVPIPAKPCGLTTAMTRVASLRGADEGVRPYTSKRAARKPPLVIRKSILKHLHACHLDGVLPHRSGDRDMMPFVSLQRIRVLDHQNLLIAIGDNDHFFAASEALLGEGLTPGVGARGSALGVSHPSVDGGALP